MSIQLLTKKKRSQIGPLNDLSVDQTLRPVSGPLGKTPVRDKIASVFNNIGIHKFAWMDTLNKMIALF